MKMYRMKQWILWVLIVGISIGTYPMVPIFGATDKRKEPDPKAVVYRVYETGTTKAISPQKGDVVDIYLTMKDANLKASDFDKIENPMVAKKKTDSFEVTSSANAELSSEIRDYGNDGIVFQIKFSKLEYTGSDDKLIFDFSYQLDGTKKKELIVSVPNCIEYSRSDYTGTTPKIEVNNKTITGFNLLSNETLKLLQVISNGKYLINGFTNKYIRKEIFDKSDSKYIINRTTRLLYKLKCHGIIKKVARKNKYYLTTNGRNLISSILVFTNRQLLN